MPDPQKISTCLLFNGEAEEAANFYVSVFPGAKIVSVLRSPGGVAGLGSGVIAVTFELEGQELMALNGGHKVEFTPAVSLFVRCQSQAEIDTLWQKLLDGGEEIMCGWLKDKFGVHWQIVPAAFGELLGDPDPAKAGRAFQAMLQMKKLDIDKLRAAHAGG